MQSVTAGPERDSLVLEIMGVEVVARRGETVFAGTRFDDLAEGDLVEVSGFPITGERLQATRVEKRDTFMPGSSQVELQGTVSALDEESFVLG